MDTSRRRLGKSAHDVTEALRRLTAAIGSDPLVDLIEREMNMHFPDVLDAAQLREASSGIALVVRRRTAELV